MAAGRVLLSVRDLWVEYPGNIVALRGVNLEVYPGEILGLLGENGSGKTTLAKTVTGMVKPRGGQMYLLGKPFSPKNIVEAMRYGISLVPQHPLVFDSLTVREDIAITVRSLGLKIGRRDLDSLIEAISGDLGFTLNAGAPISRLSMAEKQRIDIIRALLARPRILILDETTAHFTQGEFTRLLTRIKRYLAGNSSIVLITHKLREALSHTNRIVVLRQGRIAGAIDLREAHVEEKRESLENEILKLMFNIDSRNHKMVRAEKSSVKHKECRGTVLEVKNLWLRRGDGEWALRGLSFRVDRGEVVGIAGIAGNGQLDLFEAIIGLRVPDRGEIKVNGVNIAGRGPRALLEHWVAIIPGERLGWALVPGKDLVFNTALALQGEGFLLRKARLQKMAQRIIEAGQVKVESPATRVDLLSGGNMQRFIVMRELLKNPSLVVAMNPTLGLDAISSSKIARTIKSQAKNCTAVLLISEDLDEISTLSDKVYVIERGSFRNGEPVVPDLEVISSLIAKGGRQVG